MNAELDKIIGEREKLYEISKKLKPSKRGWRFAYDMYCRELMQDR
jgi:hypothetical protein